ncbi:hypothetical protein [Oleiagrimonas sp. MCCC 1A03011]|uniref:hypothetical protein n=1 Tax=Oleiagrimonas sp. MCCC 1A03011 TaxID=1926883 RepID=UPI0011BD4626|nr:hypothetical protein [Oleiagrimonas sp. MCCC 1A03011]
MAATDPRVDAYIAKSTDFAPSNTCAPSQEMVPDTVFTKKANPSQANQEGFADASVKTTNVENRLLVARNNERRW